MASHGVPRVAGAAKNKSEAAKQKEKQQIQKYLELEGEVQQRIRKKDYSEESFALTTQLLTQNPEYYTIWNFRRRILQSFISQDTPLTAGSAEDAQRRHAAEEAGLTVQQRDILLIIKEDLQFLVPLLKQFPKCYWIWDHRIWLLGEAMQHLSASHAIELWRFELGLVTKMLALDSRNFHGWDYRRKAVSELERLSKESMVASEFEYTTKMIKSNLSNFSAWHNRSQLIPRLLQGRGSGEADRRKFFETEIEYISTALYTDPYDQSLWFYHQYLLSTLDPASPTNSDAYARDTRIMSPVNDQVRARYIGQELDSVREMLDGAEDCKYIYQALLEYTLLHRAVGGAASDSSITETSQWLQELRKLDPLREGRWADLERKLAA